MKLKITLLLCSFVIFSNAQIVLQENNTPHSSTYENVRKFNTAGVAAIPIEGANQMYDYSTLPNPTGNSVVNYNPAIREGFNNFTRYSVVSNLLGSISINSEFYTKKDATGIMRVGTYKLPQSVNLETITGNNLDFLNFPGSSNIFTTPFYTVKFPTSFGMSWSSDTSFHTDFLLTVAAFGLDNTPGYQDEVATNTNEVVGWGQLILPTTNGPSIPYDILLIKNQNVFVNNYFINDAPAPTVLLNAFGVSQGETITENAYFFYAADFEKPIFTIVMSEDSSTVDFSYYDPTFLQTLGINDASFSKNNIIAYPNPVKDFVIIDIKTEENVPYTIYSITGELMLSGTINANNNKIELNDFSPSIYVLKMQNKTIKLMKTD